MKKQLITAIASIVLLSAILVSCSNDGDDDLGTDESTSVSTEDTSDSQMTEDVSDTSDTTTEEVTTEAPETEPPEPEPVYEYKTDVTKYLEYIDNRDEQYQIVASREYPIGEEYAPTDLVKLPDNNYGYLRECAAMAFKAMMQEMKALKVYDVPVSSSYRSYDYQVKLYDKYIRKETEAHPDYTEEQIIALVDTYSARAGTSDHQTGLTIDFYPVSNRYEKTKSFKFMMENGYKFGFILRYPEGKTDITGYKYEPWHWRFVGRAAATEIHERGITLEEYLGLVPTEEQ